MTGQVKKGRYFVGSVGVDAGIVWAGDPCYIKHHPELYDESKWGDFCVNMKDLPGEKYSGVVTHTNFGDGEYPVFVSFDKSGDPTKLEVVFTRMTSEKDEANTIQYEDEK
jgi:hypothetical protein